MRCLRRVASGALLATGPALLQAQAAERPWVSRGRQVQKIQSALATRTAAFHDTLAAALTLVAPDLLPNLEPPPLIRTGYQLLPKIVRGAPPNPNPPPSVLLNYGWNWSTTLIDNEQRALDSMTARFHAPGARTRRSALDSLVKDYQGVIERKKRLDADVNYNWLWQPEIARIRAVFDRNTATQNAILRMRSTQTPAARAADSVIVADGLAADVGRMDPPGFLAIAREGAVVTVTVPMVTDITDSAFVAEFRRAVTERWRVTTDTVEYRVAPEIRMLDPRAVHCADANLGAQGCFVPKTGESINVNQHVTKFPPNVGVLTTGAGSTHFTGGRAIVMSPHEAPWYLIAHEFGHMLGFHDAYIRGYRDAGADGFIVTELVVDNSDLMGNARDGAVKPSHFERLMQVLYVPNVMKAGLNAYYVRGDARTAAVKFREVLRLQPGHYGAMYQLAKVLDAQGAKADARQWWTKVLAVAQQVGDTVTAKEAKARLP